MTIAVIFDSAMFRSISFAQTMAETRLSYFIIPIGAPANWFSFSGYILIVPYYSITFGIRLISFSYGNVQISEPRMEYPNVTSSRSSLLCNQPSPTQP